MVLVDGSAGGPVSAAWPVGAAADVATDAAQYGLTVSGVGVSDLYGCGVCGGCGASGGGDGCGGRGGAWEGGGGVVGGCGWGWAGQRDGCAGWSRRIASTGVGAVPLGGDVDGDGQVNGEDARLLALYSVDPGHPGLPAGIGLPVAVAGVAGRVPSLVRGGGGGFDGA